MDSLYILTARAVYSELLAYTKRTAPMCSGDLLSTSIAICCGEFPILCDIVVIIKLRRGLYEPLLVVLFHPLVHKGLHSTLLSFQLTIED